MALVRPAIIRRIMKEVGELETSPPEGIRVAYDENNVLDLTGIIQGPEDTPYAGGYFRVRFLFTNEFPAAPPKCRFTTKIFHPNVSSSGEICVNTLKKDWKPDYGIGHILTVVRCLLIYPNPESALDEEAGRLLLEGWESFADRAKLITSVHAIPRVPPPEFKTPSSTPGTTSAPTSASTPASAASSAASTPSTAATSTTSDSVPTVTVGSSTTTTLPTLTKPTQQPLNPSASNKGKVSPSPAPSSEKEKGKEKDRHVSSPLGTADSNTQHMALPGKGIMGDTMGNPRARPGTGVSTMTTNKAVKRTAASSLTSQEKRKKALKRL